MEKLGAKYDSLLEELSTDDITLLLLKKFGVIEDIEKLKQEDIKGTNQKPDIPSDFNPASEEISF